MGQNPPPVQRPTILVRASELLRQERYVEAEGHFARYLDEAQVQDSGFRAEAHFGRAFAVQQILVRSDSAPTERVRDAVRDYLEAASLDSSTHFGAAQNNAALLLRAAGDHAAAVRYFLIAAETRHPARAYFYFNAGQEYEALERRDSAASAYRRALAVDRAYAEALQALLSLYLEARVGDSVVALASRSATGAGATLVQEALLALMEQRDPPLSPVLAESSLVIMARAYASNNPGPPLFTAAHRRPLLRAGEAHPPIRAGINALVHAYPPPGEGGRLYREPQEAGWWREREARRAAWSSLLRSQGDWHNRAGNAAAAESYYEAALGWPEMRLMEPWVDVEALLPLAVLYAKRAAGVGDKSERYLRELEMYEEMLFSAKMRAYQANDVRRIRSLHMTLGALYSERGQWGPGVRGAVFQLEHMRQMTERLARDTRADVTDPPDLLEKLLAGYLATDQRTKAEALAKELRDTFTRQNRSEDAARVDRMVRPLRRPR